MNTEPLHITIWQQNHERIKQFICGKVNGDDRCNDILHDLFLKINDKQEKIALVEKPASYIIKMAQNAVVDFYRTKKGLPTELCECSSPESIEQFSTSEQYNITLLPFIENLPDKYKEAIVLSELNGLSQKEVAEKLDISYPGARSRIQRGRQMLKEAILKCCDYRFDKFGNIIGCCE